MSHLTDLPLVTVQGLRGALTARARKTAWDAEENEMTAFRIGLERAIYDHRGEPVGIGFTVYDVNAPIIGLAFRNADDARKGAELVQQLFALVTTVTPLRY